MKVWIYPKDKHVEAVSKATVTNLDYIMINLTLKHYQGVQLELLPLYTNFHADQLKIVQENEANRFCILLTLWPLVKVELLKVA